MPGVERSNTVRIIQIGNYPPPVCGWAIHTKEVQDALRRKGVECKVLDIGPGRRVRSEDQHCTPMRGAFDFLVKIIAFRLRGYVFEPHVNGDSWKGYLLALAAVMLGRLTFKPAVLMFHAGPEQLYFPRRSGFWYQAFRILFRASGAIICNLESVQREIIKYGVPAEKVHAIFSVNYSQDVIPVSLPTHVDRFLRAHKPCLFSYTLFRPEFTPDVLFEAFAGVRQDYPGAGLLIAGPSEVPPDIQNLIKQWNLESDVLISGNLAHNEFLTALSESDVFVRTHLRDGLCASVIEALSLGVPVVASEDGIRPRSVLTYSPPVARELLRALLSVFEDVDHARQRVQKADVKGNLDQEINLLLSVARGQ
jgi:glycosyltransferase involved in cell wall biosynthesis